MLQKDTEIYKLTEGKDPKATANYLAMQDKHRRKKAQYYGEGSLFLLLILVGGIIVYFSFRKRLQLTAQQNNFMMAVTHELKSPLAGIKLSLETMSKRKLTAEQQEKLLYNSVTETDRLNELCNNILLSTQLDGKQYMAKNSDFDIRDLIAQCVDNFSNRFEDVTFKQNLYIKDGNYNGDYFLWSMIINNLLENAHKYAGAAGPIVLDAYESGEEFIIQVADLGPGVQEVDKKRIFEKFYRSGDENTRNSKGTGLGLHIVKRAVEYHGGSIAMEDNTPKGNIAIIKTPKQR